MSTKFSGAAVSTADRDARLRRQVDYCLRSSFYRDRFEEAGVDPAGNQDHGRPAIAAGVRYARDATESRRRNRLGRAAIPSRVFSAPSPKRSLR